MERAGELKDIVNAPGSFPAGNLYDKRGPRLQSCPTQPQRKP